MADVPYTPAQSSIPRMLKHIQTAGIPSKVTQKYLLQVGFKSSNDRYLIPVFKALGFLDGSGSPTTTWKAYRDKAKAGAVLATAIRTAYADLFATYPDAYRKDTEAIHNFFGARTDFSEVTLARAVATFRTLCKAADFGAEPPKDLTVQLPEDSVPTVSAEAHPTPGSQPSISINIQLQLPETTKSEVYENLFAAMRKHLFTGGD